MYVMYSVYSNYMYRTSYVDGLVNSLVDPTIHVQVHEMYYVCRVVMYVNCIFIFTRTTCIRHAAVAPHRTLFLQLQPSERFRCAIMVATPVKTLPAF